MATGSRIRHYRLKLKWTLDQLSERTGVDVGTLSALEIRDSSRSSKFLKIAPAFGLTLEQLADESTDYDVYDVHPPRGPNASDPAKFLAKEAGIEASDAWLKNALAMLQRIHPDHHSETLSYLEWQVARKPHPQNGHDLPLAA